MEINFNKFIKEDQIKHPLSIWHTEYLKAKNKKIPAPEVPKNNFDTYKIFQIMELRNYTNGLHQFRDQEDVPATNPLIGIIPDIFITKSQENKLKGLTGFIINDSNGSFHERWAAFDVFIILTKETQEEFDYITFNPNLMKRRIDGFFTFESIEQVLKLIGDLNNVVLDYDEESSDKYWEKISSKYQPEPRTIKDDESDSWFNKKVLFTSKSNLGVITFFIGNIKYTYQLDPIDLNKIWSIKDKSPWQAVNMIKNLGVLINKV